jgi:hypothetical protein
LIPTLMIIGAIAGGFTFPRTRLLIWEIVVATVLWMIIAVIGEGANNLSETLWSLGLGIGNLGIGAAVGWSFALLVRGRSSTT